MGECVPINENDTVENSFNEEGLGVYYNPHDDRLLLGDYPGSEIIANDDLVQGNWKFVAPKEEISEESFWDQVKNLDSVKQRQFQSIMAQITDMRKKNPSDRKSEDIKLDTFHNPHPELGVLGHASEQAYEKYL